MLIIISLSVHTWGGINKETVFCFNGRADLNGQ